ncbi:hypothetical protein GUJ93_ZPchr0012g21591, partial [Zizania palustris]
DAKEHLFALADKLGSSLKDIDLIKSSPGPTDPSEQDYDAKAEDAVDYEDIDEEYDGPEVDTATEEDHLLSKKDYFSTNAVYASLNSKVSVFDEENYDEEEEPPNNNELHGGASAEQLDMAPSSDILAIEKMPTSLSESEEGIECEAFEEKEMVTEDQFEPKTATSLPVLCIEDGSVILRFSEIFGVQEPVRKAKTDRHKHPVNKELQITNVTNIVEEDEEVFLRSTIQNLPALKHTKMNDDFVESDIDESTLDVSLRLKDLCLCEQPMKDKDIPTALQSLVCPDFYPFEHEDWENDIVWGNSPTTEIQPFLTSCAISEESLDADSEDQTNGYGYVSGGHDVQSKFHSFSLMAEPFGRTKMSDSTNYCCPENSYPPLRKDTQEKDSLDELTDITESVKIDTMQHLNKLSLLNKELLDGSWLHNIVWDPSEGASKPKLIFDLKDDHMLFEILDEKNGDHLRSHARAMIVSQPMKTSLVENVDHNNQAITLSGRFNISNDKFYSSRKMSQQARSHTKKHASMGLKVVHSVPAQKLQTMKPKLSIKEITNFHRPKAKWYPHENKLAVKFLGDACIHGPMTAIVMTLGGKGVKFLVNAEETPVSVKSKASKKLEFKPSEKIKLFCSGKELQDDISLAVQNVRPNSILHVVRTEVHLWPKAQRLPGENKPLRPPGAFRKKTDLSVKDGHVFLMEYCEGRPLLLANAGMGARLCTYYQKTSPSDQTAASLRTNSDGLGTTLAIDPADKSPFLGNIRSGSHQSCLETNMYRAPVFPHKVASDYLLVRSAKGMLSLRRIDKLYAVGQQEPHMEVFSPGTKNMQNYLLNRILVYVYREFRAREKPGVLPLIQADELPIQSPITDAIVRKRLKHCADLRKGPKGHLFFIQRSDFRIPSEEELRRLLTPENADGAAHQNIDHLPEDLPEEEWAPWPIIPEQPQDIMADQPMEEISVGLSAVYDPSGNESITVSDGAAEVNLDQNPTSPVNGVQNLTLANLEQQMLQLQSAIEALRLSSTDIDMPDAASCEAALRDDSLELPIEATQKRITPQITIVYKRRRRSMEVLCPVEEMVVSPPQKRNIQTSQVGLRRSARIRNKLLGFRKGNPPGQTNLHHIQADPSSSSKGKEVFMPAMPSLQDFINATAAGMFHTPLSIDQIQHSAIHICDIDAAHVSEDKLSAGLGGDTQIVPFAGNSLNENDKDSI